jgi:hypothetical protein
MRSEKARVGFAVCTLLHMRCLSDMDVERWKLFSTFIFSHRAHYLISLKPWIDENFSWNTLKLFWVTKSSKYALKSFAEVLRKISVWGWIVGKLNQGMEVFKISFFNFFLDFFDQQNIFLKKALKNLQKILSFIPLQLSPNLKLKTH